MGTASALASWTEIGPTGNRDNGVRMNSRARMNEKVREVAPIGRLHR
jgi:hypothetical protein